LRIVNENAAARALRSLGRDLPLPGKGKTYPLFKKATNMLLGLVYAAAEGRDEGKKI
jgi:hypothetical protein